MGWKMRYVSEADMKIKDINPESKYLEKLFARYPLLGNAVLLNIVSDLRQRG